MSDVEQLKSRPAGLRSNADHSTQPHKWICVWPKGCTNFVFNRRSDLERYCKTVHEKIEAHWCPFAGCLRSKKAVGGVVGKPFPREDKRNEYVRKTHGHQSVSGQLRPVRW